MGDRNSVVELAIIRMKPEAVSSMPEMRQLLQKWLEGVPGFLKYVPYQSFEDSSVFADYLEWDSLESAKGAAKHFANSAAGASLMSGVEATLFFGHFVPTPMKEQV